MAKVQVLVWLEPETNTKLRGLIQSKYQKYERGLLSNEIEQAVLNWVALHTSAQTSLEVTTPNPTFRVRVVFQQVKNYLTKTFYDELQSGQQINVEHVRTAIAECRGSDKRTVEKWLRSFVKMKLLKPVAGAVWEIM